MRPPHGQSLPTLYLCSVRPVLSGLATAPSAPCSCSALVLGGAAGLFAVWADLKPLHVFSGVVRSTHRDFTSRRARSQIEPFQSWKGVRSDVTPFQDALTLERLCHFAGSQIGPIGRNLSDWSDAGFRVSVALPGAAANVENQLAQSGQAGALVQVVGVFALDVAHAPRQARLDGRPLPCLGLVVIRDDEGRRFD